MVCFYTFNGCFYQKKLNVENFGLFGTDFANGPYVMHAQNALYDFEDPFPIEYTEESNQDLGKLSNWLWLHLYIEP